MFFEDLWNIWKSGWEFGIKYWEGFLILFITVMIIEYIIIYRKKKDKNER